MKQALSGLSLLACHGLTSNLTAQTLHLRNGQIPSTLKTLSALQYRIAGRKGLFGRDGLTLEILPIDGGAANRVLALNKGASRSPARRPPI